MADEIVIPLRLWNHRVNNANASWDQLTATTNAHMASGIRLRNAEATDINFCLSQYIPTNINGTPNARIQFHWITDSADTSSNIKLFLFCSDVYYNNSTADPGSWDDSLTVLDASTGQYFENSCQVTLVTTTVVYGRQIRGVIRRDAVDAADTLAADILLTSAVLIADQA